MSLSDQDRLMDLRSKESEVSSSGLENDKRDNADDIINDTHGDMEASNTAALSHSTQRPLNCSSLTPPPVGGNSASAAGDSLQESVAKVCLLFTQMQT